MKKYTVDLPVEMEQTEKRECIDIKEVEHEGGGGGEGCMEKEKSGQK